MKIEQLWLAAAVGVSYYHGYVFVVAQPGVPEATSTSIMTNPADRTYPTTITSTFSMTTTGTAAVTVDHVTVLDPWQTLPDPESAPFTMLQTLITQRVISPPAATPSTTAITATKTWIIWGLLPFDMPITVPPECPGPDGCAYHNIKPSELCYELGQETRCAAQCLMKDYLWWCTKPAAGETPMGRICDGGNSTAYVQLLEPCDHTDFKPGCPLCPDYNEEEEQG